MLSAPGRPWLGVAAVVGGVLAILATLLVSATAYLRKPPQLPQLPVAESLNVTELLNQHFSQNKLEEVINGTDNLLVQDPTNVQALLFQAAALAQRGTLEFREAEFGQQAIEVAQRVLILDPENAEAYRIIGYANEIMGRYDEALVAYNQALALSPNNTAVLDNRGHVYDLMGEFELAKLDYEAARVADPGYLPAVQNMARVQIRENNYAVAKELFAQVAQQTDSVRLKAEAENNLSTIALYFDNDEAKSLEFAQQATTTDPKLAHAYVAQARIFISRQRWQEAANALTSALEIYPNLTVAHEWLGMGYMKLGAFQEAITAFQAGRSAAEVDIHLMNNERVSTQARFDYYLATAHAAVQEVAPAVDRLRSAMSSPSFDITTIGMISETIRHGKSGLFASLVGTPAYEELARTVSGEALTPPTPTGQQPIAAIHFGLVRTAHAAQFFQPKQKRGGSPTPSTAPSGTVIQYFPHGPGSSIDITYGNFLRMYANGQVTFEQLFTICESWTRQITSGKIGCNLVRYANGEITIGCWNAVAARYVPNPPPARQCNNKVDDPDPEDTLADAADPGCHTDGNVSNAASYVPTDDDETNPPVCSDGKDNDGDARIDVADPACHPSDRNENNVASYVRDHFTEVDTQCSDKKDNDSDRKIDAADPGCHTDGNPDTPESYDPQDDSEADPVCSDGLDNDGDNRVDVGDPGCHPADYKVDNVTSFRPFHHSEADTECSDAVDNLDPEDSLADSTDPGCHFDRKTSNKASYNPADTSELDSEPNPQPAFGPPDAKEVD